MWESFYKLLYKINFNDEKIYFIFSSNFMWKMITSRGGYGLEFSKSNLDSIQIKINGLDLKSISILTR